METFFILRVISTNIMVTKIENDVMDETSSTEGEKQKRRIQASDTLEGKYLEDIQMRGHY
jgi:hypothetical protein